MPHDSGLMVRQKHVTSYWYFLSPGTYACIVLRHDVNLQRHYTCKNTAYMWRYYDWLNPQCGATYDAEGPCGVIMSVEIAWRGLRYIVNLKLATTELGPPWQWIGGDICIDWRVGMGFVSGFIHVYLNVPGLLLLPFCERSNWWLMCYLLWKWRYYLI
jgi:hypothetical protein